MGLEAPNYLNDLDIANPTYQDFIAEGDDHLRGFKKAAKQTFPGMAGRAWRKRSVSVSGPLVLTDNMTLVVGSQALTLTPAAANVLGNGWMVMIRATGGNITIDPGENINGAASMQIPTGYTGIIMCDGSEFYAMLMYQDVPPSVKAFPTGTTMAFHNAAAPTGWTRLTNAVYDNAAIRMTTGTIGAGGSDGFVGVFGAGKSTSGFSLSEVYNGPHAHAGGRDGSAAGVGPGWGGDGTTVLCNYTMTASSGSGAAHAHPIPTMNIKYLDFLLATIN